MAFLLSAYISWSWVLFAYCRGLIPEELLTTADKLFYKAKSNPSAISEDWRKAFQKGVMIFSDQQIVTGIAILIAGFANIRTISVYHYHVVVYLAWMSSNVHLTTLTVLRDFLQRNPLLRAWRVVGMLVLFGLLLVALIPTSGYLFSLTLQKVTSESDISPFGNGTAVPWYHYDGDGPLWVMAIPARCFWSLEYRRGTSTDGMISFVFLIVSYAWKVGLLYKRSEQGFRRWIRTKPLFVREKAIKVLAIRRRGLTGRDLQQYRILVSEYVVILSLLDFCESLAASIWFLTIGLAWGTLQILQPRAGIRRDIQQEENKWSFGQIMPLLLLALPLIAVLENFYSKACKLVFILVYTNESTQKRSQRRKHNPPYLSHRITTIVEITGKSPVKTTSLSKACSHHYQSLHTFVTLVRCLPKKIRQTSTVVFAYLVTPSSLRPANSMATLRPTWRVKKKPVQG